MKVKIIFQFIVGLGILLFFNACNEEDPCFSVLAGIEEGTDSTYITFTSIVPNTLEEFYNEYIAGTEIQAGDTAINLLENIDCESVNVLHKETCRALMEQMPITLTSPIPECIDINPDCNCSDDDCEANQMEMDISFPPLGIIGAHVAAEVSFTSFILGEMAAYWTYYMQVDKENDSFSTTSQPAMLIEISLPPNMTAATIDLDAHVVALDPTQTATMNAALDDNVNGHHEVQLNNSTIKLWLVIDHNNLSINSDVIVDVDIDEIIITDMDENIQEIILDNFLSASYIEDVIEYYLASPLQQFSNNLIEPISQCLSQNINEKHLLIDNIKVVESTIEQEEPDLQTILFNDENIYYTFERETMESNTVSFILNTVYEGSFDYDDFTPTVTVQGRNDQENLLNQKSIFHWTNVETGIVTEKISKGEYRVNVDIPKEKDQYKIIFYADPEKAGIFDKDTTDNSCDVILYWGIDYRFINDDEVDQIEVSASRMKMPAMNTSNITLNFSGVIHNYGLDTDPNGVNLYAYYKSVRMPDEIVSINTYDMSGFNGTADFAFSIFVGELEYGDPPSITIKAVIDPTNEIDEILEENNTRYLTYINSSKFENLVNDIINNFNDDHYDLEPDYNDLIEILPDILNGIVGWEPDVNVKDFINVENLQNAISGISSHVSNETVKNTVMIIDNQGFLNVYNETNGEILISIPLLNRK